MRVTTQERESAIEDLKKLLKPGDTVWTVLRHVSRSGMNRIIGVRKLDNGNSLWLSRGVAKATGITFSEKYEELSVGGCGMDMGFHVVYELSARLFKDGFGCIGEGCPSNDHSNGDRSYRVHHAARFCPNECGYEGSCTTCPKCVFPTDAWVEPRDHWHKDGGYALSQRWI
jgi:hypothetical protein